MRGFYDLFEQTWEMNKLFFGAKLIFIGGTILGSVVFHFYNNFMLRAGIDCQIAIFDIKMKIAFQASLNSRQHPRFKYFYRKNL